jgi:hypothetical protein
MCNFLVYCADPRKKRAAVKAAYSMLNRIGGSDTSPRATRPSGCPV